MRQFALSVFAVLAFLPTVSQAQLFPRLFGGKSTQVGSACPGGVCPTAAPASNYRSVGVAAIAAAPVKAIQNRAGHWSYHGSIDSHLEGTHGVSTAGMTHAQKLALHDSLHEGTAAPRSNYPAVSSSVGYGSSGVRVSGYGSNGSAVGYGSSGSLAVGSVLSDGAVVTSVGVTVAKDSSLEVTQLRIGDRSSFRKALLDAGRKAKASGEITSLEFFLLSAASRNPRTLERMQAAVHEAAIEEGLATATAIDWDALIEFIEKLIPIIIKLIELFGQTPNATAFPYV